MFRAFLLLVVLAFPAQASADVPDLSDQVSAPSGVCDSIQVWCNAKKLVGDVLTDLVEIAQDLFLWVLDQLLTLFGYILGLLPPLDFLSFDWSSLSPLFWFMDRLQLDVALGIFGAALVFRLTRKLLTLGQW